MFDTDRTWVTITAVLLAVAGGLARLLNVKDRRRLKWSRLLSELFISGFSGLMVLMFARASGLSGDWIGVVCGISGWVGPRILDTLASFLKRSVGLKDTDSRSVSADDEHGHP